MLPLTLLVSLAVTAPSGPFDPDGPDGPTGPTGGERFAPIPTRLADYRALRDVARVVLSPAAPGGLETDGVSLCAFGRGGELTCVGALTRPREAGAPCFGPPGSFETDPIVDLALDPSSCAVTRSGRLFCAAPLTWPMLSPAGSGAPAPLISFSTHAALYADRTIRTIRTGLDGTPRLSAPRPMMGGPETLLAMSATDPDALCLLGADGHVHCTDWDAQSDRSEATPDGPIHFERVGAPRRERGFGPYERCAERPCKDALTGVVQITHAGRYETCALLRDGEVVCWDSPRHRPHRLPRFTRPVSIAASRSGLCAVTQRHEVECLGFDALDETGDEAVVEPVARVPGLVGVKSVVLSREALCAVTAKGTVDCRHLRSRPTPEPEGPDLDGDAAEPRYGHDAEEPAVALIPWTRDLVDLGFAGTWLELDEALSPLIGVTHESRLLGTRPPAGMAAGRPGLVPGLPCLHLGGRVFCRKSDERGERWEPWREVGVSAADGSPWWLGLSLDAVSADEPLPELSDLEPLMAKDKLRPVELVGWDGLPCLRFEGGEVRCVRRGPTAVELVALPAPLPATEPMRGDAGSDICTAYIQRVAGPAENDLGRVIDLDGSHRTLCALRDNGDIACWGDLSGLPDEDLEADARPQARRYAPKVLATVVDAVELAVTPTFVCARTRVGEVHCIGEAGRGRAPGRWGGFGARPSRLAGVTGLTRLVTLPGHPLACGFSSAVRSPSAEERPSERAEKRDPRDDPRGALAEAIASGQAVCWGEDEALRYLNATFLGRPRRR